MGHLLRYYNLLDTISSEILLIDSKTGVFIYGIFIMDWGDSEPPLGGVSCLQIELLAIFAHTKRRAVPGLATRAVSFDLDNKHDSTSSSYN